MPFMTPLPGNNSNGKLEFLSAQSNTRSISNLLTNKIEMDEEDEMAIHTLEKELKEKRGQLEAAKFKYE